VAEDRAARSSAPPRRCPASERPRVLRRIPFLASATSSAVKPSRRALSQLLEEGLLGANDVLRCGHRGEGPTTTHRSRMPMDSDEPDAVAEAVLLAQAIDQSGSTSRCYRRRKCCSPRTGPGHRHRPDVQRQVETRTHEGVFLVGGVDHDALRRHWPELAIDAGIRQTWRRTPGNKLLAAASAIACFVEVADDGDFATRRAHQIAVIS
jgi:hypothetical protein